MKDFIFMKALAIVIPVIVGPIAYILMQSLKRVWAWLDGLPTNTKRALVFALTFALTAATQVLGLTLPAECAAIGTGALTSDCQSALSNPVFLKTIVATLLAYGMHKLKKDPPNT